MSCAIAASESISALQPASSSTTRLCRIEPLEARIAPAAAVLELSSLDGTNGFKISGVAAGDESGFSVSGAGDINGDGFDDLIVGAFRADPNGIRSGASYVVFGSSAGFEANLDLSSLDGTNGFQISGEKAGDRFGFSVSGAGDINGDGFDDLIIGAQTADPNSVSSGASYVVFGRGAGFEANLDLSSLDGTNGFQISGQANSYYSGFSVSGAGDINGDGFDDLIIGAIGARPNGNSSGASYVVFGSDAGFAENLNLSILDGTNGFQISGEAANDASGVSVSGAGDINGDGFDDLIVGASGARPNGASYVVFGSGAGFEANLDLSSLDGTNGFQISGEAKLDPDLFGQSVSGAGDINGDGFDDLIVGAYWADPNGRSSGASYVVFGRGAGFAADLNLSSLDGTNGFQISGEAANDGSGRSVSGAGDINGDGFDDLIVGAPYADPNGRSSGASYVVFGRGAGFAADLSLSSLDGINGFQISGGATGDGSGRSVSGAGNVNGDGFDDLMIGALGADPKGSSSGASYVVFGAASVQLNLNTVIVKDSDGDTVTIKVEGGKITPQDITLGPDGKIARIDLTRFAGVGGKTLNLSITAKTAEGGGGDGVVDVGLVDATDLDLGKVLISGTLGRILVGDGDAKKPALKSLTVGSLGTSEPVTEPLLSEILGSLGKLTVLGDVRGAAIEVQGKLGNMTIGGDLVGDTGTGAAILASIFERGVISLAVGPGGGVPVGAVNANSVGKFTVKGNVTGGAVTSQGDIGSVTVGSSKSGGNLSGSVAAAGQIKVVKVFRDLNSEDPSEPVVVAALAKVGSSKPAGAVAINNVTVRGDVENAQILLGYRKETNDDGSLRYDAKNPDASAGKVLVQGNWTASSLVAGVIDATGDGFGRNDTPIAGDTTARILARIASLVIKGTATGSAAEGDHYGISAQQIGKLSIAGQKMLLNKDAKDDLPLGTSGDFRLVEL